MKNLLLPILLLPCAACANLQASPLALCLGTKADRQAHAEALIVDGGPQSRVSGANLLGSLDAGCRTAK